MIEASEGSIIKSLLSTVEAADAGGTTFASFLAMTIA
jgi:hypothetical protein